MIQTFKVKKGEISFETDKVKISDNSRKQNRIQLFSSAMWTIYGAISVLRYLKTGDQFFLVTDKLKMKNDLFNVEKVQK
jgi:hypothetical protein